MHSIMICSIKNQPVKIKSGSYFCELALFNQSAKKVFISEKQRNRLIECFDRTENGYSSKKIEVHGIFDGDRFVWCGIHSRGKSDLDFLAKNFGVSFDSPYIGHISDDYKESLKITQPLEALKDAD